MSDRMVKFNVSTMLLMEDNIKQVLIRIEDNGPGFSSQFSCLWTVQHDKYKVLVWDFPQWRS